MTRRRGRLALLTSAIGLLAALALTGCGASGTSSASTDAGGSGPAGSSPSATTAGSASSGSPDSGGSTNPGGSTQAGTTVKVSETEMHLALSSSSVPAGRVVLDVHNAGSITHALSVQTPDGTKSTDDIAPGASATLTVDLTAGSVELWCPVGDHKMEGMDTHLTVS